MKTIPNRCSIKLNTKYHLYHDPRTIYVFRRRKRCSSFQNPCKNYRCTGYALYEFKCRANGKSEESFLCGYWHDIVGDWSEVEE